MEDINTSNPAEEMQKKLTKLNPELNKNSNSVRYSINTLNL